MDGDDKSDLTSAGLVLFHLAQHSIVTQQELASALGVSLREVARLTADLAANGLLRCERNGRYDRYTLTSVRPTLTAQSGASRLSQLLALLQERAASPKLQATGTGGVKWLFQQVWEHSSEAMLLSDPRGIVLAANAAFVELSGYPGEELVGHDHSLMLAQEDREWAQTGYRRIFASDSPPLKFEMTIQHKDGSLLRISGRTAFLTENFRRTAMLSIVHEIAVLAPLGTPDLFDLDMEAFLAKQGQIRIQACRQRLASRKVLQQTAALRLELERHEITFRKLQMKLLARRAKSRMWEDDSTKEMPPESVSRPQTRELVKVT